MLKRGLLGYLPVNIVQAVSGFGAIVVFTRLLSAEDYGAYALGFSVMSLVHTCLFTWLEASMARFYLAEPEGEARATLLATLYRSYAVLAGVFPVVAALILWATPVSGGVKWAIGAGLASILSRSALKLGMERRRAVGAVGGYAWLDMAQTGGGFLLGVGLAALGWGGAAPLAGMGVAAAILLAFSLPFDLKMAGRGDLDRKRVRSYAAYGLPLSISLVMSIALATTDRFVLAAYLNEGAVGAYHAGYSLSSRTLDVLFIWFGMAAGPAAVAALERGGEAALKRTALDQAKLMVLIAVPAAVGLALVAAPLAQIMVGPNLSKESAMVTPWIALGALCSGVTTYYLHTAFTLARRTRLLLVAMAIPAASNLVLVLALVPRFGLEGAMWATVASYALGMTASWALGRRALALPIPWLAVAQVGLASGAMAVAVSLTPAFGGIVELLTKASVGAAVYGLVVLAMDAAGARSRTLEALSLLRSRVAGPAEGAA